ncbi:MAG: DUF4870 domain-containing protein [Bacteroidales bacterium]|nr:DUF4870 domain-containing protein [Bacteroidales bacterium]
MEQINQQVRDERMWGMFCHLSAMAGYIIPFGSIVGPLIIWSIKKDEFPFVNEQGKEALNFQISMLIYFILSAFLILIVIGILMLIALAIFQLIMIIIASIRANNGESFHYPLAIRFIN